jgi:hypothetical protein
MYTDFHIKCSFFVDCPLSGAIDIDILHSLNNQASKKVIIYENQYNYSVLNLENAAFAQSAKHSAGGGLLPLHCLFRELYKLS